MTQHYIIDLAIVLKNKHLQDNIEDHLKEFTRLCLKKEDLDEDINFLFFDNIIDESLKKTITHFPNFDKELKEMYRNEKDKDRRKEREEAIKAKILSKHLKDTCIKNNVPQYYSNTRLKNIFLDLAFYDKLFKENNKDYLYMLNELLETISKYVTIYKKWDTLYKQNNSIDRTIALSSSNTIEKMALPAKKIIKDGSYLTNNPSNKILKNIYNDYINDPYEMSYVLSTSVDGIDDFLPSLGQDKRQAFKDGHRFFNASTPVQKKDIIKSFKIEISLIFGKMNKQNHNDLQSRKIISNIKLAEHIDSLIYELFNTRLKTSPKTLNNPIQLRTHFEKIPLYEYITSRNKKILPPLKNEKYFIMLTDFLKGKIPTKTTKKN